MDFNFTEEQTMLRDMLSRYLADTYTFDARQKVVHGGKGWNPAVWQAFAEELGVLGAPFAEAHGGLGGGAVENMVVMEEMGRAIVLEPYLSTVVIGGGALKHVGGAVADAVIPTIIAGTTRIADDPRIESSRDIAALQGSRKDLDEHRLVVERIASELRPLTTSLEFSETPSTRQVRNLVHLQTPITGELRETTSAFHLLAALHPTPAVGGFPAREAAEWLTKNEPLERGWYSGTVGWIDANGDGEIAVAIRCGVLTEQRAYVFAGAGIVAASTAAAEYAETGGKMGPILRALGVLF